ncbi:MAG: O-methyltransferase [Planctomycetes bacterium]|nr:O-methyltransferase [Planctomycetota bacterium]
MTDEEAVLTRRHLEYIAERTKGDDPFLIELKQAADKADIPHIWISPAQASFMQIILKLHGAKSVIEVGTLAGYSAICMARALPEGGRVRTIELEDKHADFAEEWIAKSDVAGKVEVLRGAGTDVLPKLEVGSADACFLDADKANYPTYLDECLRIMPVGGLVMADNALGFGRILTAPADDPGVSAVRRFNDYMAAKKNVHGVIAPVGDGCWVGVKEA